MAEILTNAENVLEQDSPDNFTIKFVGLEKTKLNPEQKEELYRIAYQEALKLGRGIDFNFDLYLHVKEYQKDSKKQRYSVNLKLLSPKKIMVSDKSKKGSWKVEQAVRESFKNAKNNFKNRFVPEFSRKELWVL